MVVRGHVQNGVVVLDDGAQLPEGQEVTVVARGPSNPKAHSILDMPPVNTGACLEDDDSARVSKERQNALRGLIGIWKTDQAPNDEEVERMVEEERMKKHG
jgi:hypothetical protein